VARGTALGPEFNEQVVSIRGVDYKLRELSIGEYDDLQKKATVMRTSPLTGEDREETDTVLLLRLMVLASVIDPKMTPDKFAAMPMRAAGRLNAAVNRMHFDPEPESETKKVEDAGVTEADSGNA